MTVPFIEIHKKATRFFALFAISALAVGPLGCEAQRAGAEVAAPLPAPGSIEVEQAPALTERARVPEKEPGFIAAKVAGDGLSIRHDGDLPAFEVGDVLAGTQGGGYLVRVTGVRELGEGDDGEREVALETVPAQLTELIAETKLRIHYDAADYTRRLQERIEALSAAHGEDNEDSEDGETIASHAEALQLAGSVKLLDLAHGSLPASCGVQASGTADVDIDATLTPVLDIELEIGPKGGLNPLPEVKKLRFVASGKLTVEATLHAEGNLEGKCSVDLLALAGGAPSVPLPTLTFWVGPVPVIVTTNVVPMAKAEIALALEAAEVTAQATTSVGLAAGVDYQDKTWSTVWEPSCDASGTALVSAPGAITASCKVRAGAELRARLYGIVGPNIGVEAYARVQAETAAPYCTYDVSIDGGVNAYAGAEVGVSVGPLNLTLAEMELAHLELVHVEGPQLSGQLGDAPERSLAN